MSQPYVGEIRCFGFSFAPQGWAFCHGQLMAISQNDALFAIIGTTYGGDGQSTFGLPNLQGCVPMHWGTNAGLTTVIGQTQGSTQVTLTNATMPAHAHFITAQDAGAGGVVEKIPQPNPNAWLGPSNPEGLWVTSATLGPNFSPSTLQTVGGSLPHENMQPYLAVNFCISLFGVFPSRN
jgi:microcystin-dependent protein